MAENKPTGEKCTRKLFKYKGFALYFQRIVLSLQMYLWAHFSWASPCFFSLAPSSWTLSFWSLSFWLRVQLSQYSNGAFQPIQMAFFYCEKKMLLICPLLFKWSWKPISRAAKHNDEAPKRERSESKIRRQRYNLKSQRLQQCDT